MSLFSEDMNITYRKRMSRLLTHGHIVGFLIYTYNSKGALAIRRVFSLDAMITNTKFSAKVAHVGLLGYELLRVLLPPPSQG